MIQLDQILKGIKLQQTSGSLSIPIGRVVFDSRIAGKGDVFVAVTGVKADGHSFISEVIEKGVTAVICEKMPDRKPKGITFVQVGNSGAALGIAASNFYGNPSSKMKLVGVTGTNGKTTTATLLYNLFTLLGHKSGLFSTVSNFILDKPKGATHTTPDAVQMNSLMKEMVDAGCENCFMEVSSHSIDQDRISGLTYTGAIFTNLTHDHLDYHKNFENYLKAKKKYFDLLPAGAFAVINKDDRNGMVMVQNTKALVKTYALRSLADYTVKIVESHIDGMQLHIGNHNVWTRLKGEFNAYNFLAVYATAICLGEKEEEVLQAMSSLKEVRGRFETLRSESGITAIIDYAHTPDALENILSAIQQLRKDKTERIIGVIGAGGDRDKTKRPIMGKIAADMCDKLIITSDNPRSEDPEVIIAEIINGVESNLRSKVTTIVNREEAIKAACLLALKGDIILIAGKGHETYQEIKGVKHHFDDREIIASQFEQMKR
jgi:UDP-N-acetylmuramoyl-L-alanyl-D-glutamate--2,6-diaminopimelate ligase